MNIKNIKEENSGLLPVKVLNKKILKLFCTFCGDEDKEDKSDLQDAILEGELNPLICMHIQEKAISFNDFPCIERDTDSLNPSQIHLYENYNQFLWCYSYAVSVIMDEGIIKPFLQQRESCEKEEYHNNPIIREALEVFEAGVKLFESFDRGLYYELPNPFYPEMTEEDKKIDAKAAEEYEKRIHVANAVYASGLAFILGHEFSHLKLGHLKSEVSGDKNKRRELNADNLAHFYLSLGDITDLKRELKIGIVTVLCSNLLFSEKMSGGNEYPDPDIRLKNILEKMELTDDDEVWAVAAIGIQLWKLYYDKELQLPESINTYKDYFYQTLEHIKSQFK